MNKIYKLLLILICSHSVWGQSYLNTTIGIGINFKEESLSTSSIGYGHPIIPKVWITPSVRLDGENSSSINPKFELGITYSPIKMAMLTGGVIAKQPISNTWYDFFIRTDIKIFEVENSWIAGTFIGQPDKIIFGFTFKNFIN